MKSKKPVHPEPTLSPEEEPLLRAGLWRLLGKRTALYTGQESSSVPVETAQELYASICFTLGIGEQSSPQAWRALLEMGLETAFRRGQRRIEGKLEIARQRWRQVCQTLPGVENQSLADTLGSIGGFWKRYDVEFLAHEIPCDIDYQLCHPVPQALLGVDYLLEYLRRLQIENRFLRCFDPARCALLLERYCPDYRGQLINLYEPVAINVLGLALAGKPTAPLDVPQETCEKIATLLAPLSAAGRENALRKAAAQACRVLDLRRDGDMHYLSDLAAELCPRVSAALAGGNLDNIFLLFA